MKTFLHRLLGCLPALLVSLAVLSVMEPSSAVETITYYHNDIAGSPILATDAAGAVLWKENYRPYGDKLNNPPAGADNKLGFTGKPYDANTGLSYMGARYYDPVIGRFTGIDPVDFDENNLHSFNRFAYANNNPYKFVDLDGRLPVFVIPVLVYMASGAAVGGGTSAAVNAGIQYYQTGDVRIGGPGGVLDAAGDGAVVGAIFGAVGGAQSGTFAGVAGAASGSTAKGATELTSSVQRGIRSFEKRIGEHERKLADFKSNPTVRPGMEGQSKEVIEAAQQSRIRHLEKEIRTFKENIEKLKGGE